jgi:hypothetical protein
MIHGHHLFDSLHKLATTGTQLRALFSRPDNSRLRFRVVGLGCGADADKAENALARAFFDVQYSRPGQLHFIVTSVYASMLPL